MISSSTFKLRVMELVVELSRATTSLYASHFRSIASFITLHRFEFPLLVPIGIPAS